MSILQPSYVTTQEVNLRAGLPRLVAGLNRVKVGGILTIDAYGDSTTAGLFGVGGTTNSRALSPTATLAARMRNCGYTVEDRMLGCSQGCTTDVDFVSYHSGSVTLGSGWTITTGPNSVGGVTISNPGAGNLTDLTWTPGGSYQYIDITYIQQNGYGSFGLFVGGSQQGSTVVCNGTATIVKVTRTLASPTTGALSIRKMLDGNLNILRVQVRSSTGGYIALNNCGWGGSTTTGWVANTNVWDPLQVIANNYKPDVAFFNIDVNDWLTGITPATHKSQYLTILGTTAVDSDLILQTGISSATTSMAQANQLGIVTQTRYAALEYGAPVVDIYRSWGTRLLAGTLGYFGASNDPVHPAAEGYADIGNRWATALGF